MSAEWMRVPGAAQAGLKRWWAQHGFYPLVIWFGCLTFGVLLAGYAYTGTYTRYWADDYCYNAVLRADGFWKAQVSFYLYTSDRFSVIPLVGISEVFGPAAIRFWPLAAILLGLIGLNGLLKQIARSCDAALSLGERLLLAVGVLFFTFWQAPNLFQVLYWRTGMLTYFMPLVIDVFLAGLILRQAQKDRIPPWRWGLVFLLAFFAGGSSETNAALQGGALALAFAICLGKMGWDGRKTGKASVGFGQSASWTKNMLALLGLAMAGGLLAMAGLALSPSNQLRMVHMPRPASLPVLLHYSFRFGFDFIKDTLFSQPLPTLVSGLAPFGLGLAWHSQNRRRVIGRQDTAGSELLRSGLGLLAVLLGMYLIIVSICAPSVYVEVAYPELRALIAARFSMVLGVSAAAWLMASIASTAGGWLAWRSSVDAQFAARLGLVGLLLLGLVSLYPLRAAQTVFVKALPYYQARAVGWDARDREIRQLAQRGQMKIHVQALDNMAGLMELQTDPVKFPNTCTAGAYGLEEITGENR